MEPDNSIPKILLLHDGELGDICEVLAGLGLDFVESKGQPDEELLRQEWDLFFAAQRHLRIFKGRDPSQKTRRVAIIDSDSRTLRARLQRLGVDYIVARPVHPAAMQLLVLHCVYRGPERRRLSRVSVGAKLLVRNGLMKREAVLADISLHGCRLICDRPIKPGAKIKLYFPPEMGGGKAFALPVRALRIGKGSEPQGAHVVAGAFYGLSPAQGQRLRKVFESYKNGPARLKEGNGESLSGLKLSLNKAKVKAKARGAVQQTANRRTDPRVDFHEQVVTVSDEATRVLLCRDLSIGGMRVEPNDTLVPGDDLLVAVHVGARSEPMVVNAKVSRDDGAKGLVLTFYDLSKESESCLKKIVRPATAGGDEGDQNVIMSKIVERRAS